ncbi:hypothetical protein [Pedobacter sp. BAL39]|uniref:hypothetical protein n=1 Tax=Pedobacter sp. BAL39 TaxID=391596 RepID=UPI0003176DFC|nr:hypothetical protein [Pedobacter sp. BAL39]
MSRLFLSTLLLALTFTNTYSQNLPELKIPSKYQLVAKIEGDLDNDGINEIVFAYNTDISHGDKGFERILYIAKKIDGRNRIWKKNTSVLWKSKDCGFYAEEGGSLQMEIVKNTLSISQTFNHNSRHTSTFKSIFRYQDSDWFLIGSTHDDADNCDFDFRYDVNFSIGKIIIDKTYSSCDEETTPIQEDQHLTFKYKFADIPKMDGFIPGSNEVKISGTNENFWY